MSVRQKIEKLEKKLQSKSDDVYMSPHLYETEKDDERPWRESCPTCAAMTDEEYAKYEAKTKGCKWITHIVVRPLEAQED